MNNLFEVKKEVFEEALVKAGDALDLLAGKVLDEAGIYEVVILDGAGTVNYYDYDSDFTSDSRVEKTSEELNKLVDRVNYLVMVDNFYWGNPFSFEYYKATVYTRTRHHLSWMREELSQFIKRSPSNLDNVENVMLTKADVEFIEKLNKSPTMGLDASKLISEKEYYKKLDLIVEEEFQKSLEEFEKRGMSTLKAIEKDLEYRIQKEVMAENILGTLKMSALTVLAGVLIVGWWLW